MNDTENDRAPFLIPFLAALAFGLPISILWHFVATQFGLLASAITLLLGCACGLGARVTSGGWHSAGAAIIATLILIVLNISITTIQAIALTTGQPFLSSLWTIVTQGNFTDFANECVLVASTTFIRYPIALFAAYKVSDAS